MKREHDYELWDLLGRAPEPVISPFFARNVLRKLRERPGRMAGVRKWFSLNLLIPASTLAMTLLVVAFVAHNPAGPEKLAVSDSDPVSRIDPQDYEVVADLDELLASDENALWDENSSL